MQYLHTMVRVADLEASLRFYCEGLGLVETKRSESAGGRFTLVFLSTPEDIERSQKARAAGIELSTPAIELTYNWAPEDYGSARNFGHVAYGTSDIYALCTHLQSLGVTILRPPRDGRMAFVRSPDRISIELLQTGAALPPCEPWSSMANTGSW